MKYEIAIAIVDEQDLASGHKRKKEGDIISVRPYPRNCGRNAIDAYLILIVESNDNLDTMLKLTVPWYDDGTEWPPSDDDYDWHCINPPEKLGKHRFTIPLNVIKNGWMPDLDLNKVRDKNYIYQPFKSDVQLVQKFDGIGTHKTLETKDVDTYSAYADKNVELVIDMNEQVSFVYDKYKESYKYATVKEYGI